MVCYCIGRRTFAWTHGSLSSWPMTTDPDGSSEESFLPVCLPSGMTALAECVNGEGDMAVGGCPSSAKLGDACVGGPICNYIRCRKGVCGKKPEGYVLMTSMG